ncbi:hypothetical protein FS837_010746 [Tulasnella sp. UAMH 9824]|nr:hypothetical protein FS837_010746 [Tulasnella sp. UAMH 9824]
MFKVGARSSTNNATMKRIQREIRDLEREDMGEITLKPAESNVFNWTATLPGPEGSVYEGGVFKLSIVLHPDYPFSSPRVTFETRIYHMNIAPNGSICIDVLKSQWSPALSLFKVMLSISSLLTDPNPHDPLVPAIAQEYLRNRAAHDATAREWTRLYAQPPAPPKPSNGKGKAKVQTSTSQASSSRTTPSVNGASTTRSSTSQSLALSSVIDVDAPSPRGGRATEPIEIDDDDQDQPPAAANPQPTRASRGVGRRVAPGSSGSAQPPPAVAGSKRRQQNSEVLDEAGGPSAGSSSTAPSRTTRSAKRRALERGEGAPDDAIVID